MEYNTQCYMLCEVMNGHIYIYIYDNLFSIREKNYDFLYLIKKHEGNKPLFDLQDVSDDLSPASHAPQFSFFSSSFSGILLQMICLEKGK